MKDVFRGTGLYRGMFIFFLFFSLCEALLASLVILLFKDALLSLYGGSAFWLAVTALVLMSIIASVFSTYLTVKRIYFPLVKLDAAMEKVSGGDYSVRLPIEEKGDYEADIIMRKSHEYFNRMAEELSSVELLKTDFISNVSHELKTPMATINGYATLLSGEEALNEEYREYAEVIMNTSRRLAELVDSVLLLSRVDNQVIITDNTVLRLDEQLRQVLVSLEPRWSEKNLELDVNLEETEFFGNESLLYHVWLNLLGNAVKFAESKVSVELKSTPEVLTVEVSDDGQGIEESAMRHIFDRFYQGDGSHKAEGNGLGLAIAKRVVDLMEGEIFAENLPEKGCKFTVKLKKQKML